MQRWKCTAFKVGQITINVSCFMPIMRLLRYVFSTLCRASFLIQNYFFPFTMLSGLGKIVVDILWPYQFSSLGLETQVAFSSHEIALHSCLIKYSCPTFFSTTTLESWSKSQQFSNILLVLLSSIDRHVDFFRRRNKMVRCDFHYFKQW